MKFFLLSLILIAAAGCAPTKDAGGPSKEDVYGTDMETQPKPAVEAPIRSVDDMDAEITAAKSKYQITKTGFEKGSGNKATLVNATIEYGIAVMNGPGAPKQKYPDALRLYEEALKLDPENEEALKNKKLILDIYKSMGRKPPKLGN